MKNESVKNKNMIHHTWTTQACKLWHERVKGIYYFSLFTLSFFTLVACTESFEDRCRREAREFTERMCPRAMTPGMVMDSMVFVSDPIGFNYFYTLDGALDDSELLTQEVLSTFHDELLKNLREDISLKKYKERDFTFTYTYYSQSTGEVLTEAAFGPEEYH